MLDFSKIAGAKTETAPAETTARGERPKPQVWLNIGITVPMENPQTGEVEDTFISLPMGIGVDTMDNVEGRGSNQNWANMVQAKNFLLDELKKAAEGIEPGNAELVSGLEIQIRRVGAAPVPAPGENPLLSAMSGRLSVVK